MTVNYDPKQDLIDLFKILDCVEESEEGNLFKPTYISSCRVLHTAKLSEILPRLKEYANRN